MIQSIARHLKSLKTTQDSTDQSLASNASDHTLIRSEFANADDSLKSQIYKEITLDGKEGNIVYAKYDTASNANRLTLGSLIEKRNLVLTTEDLDSQKLVPVGMSEIFNQWYRFTHGNNSTRTADQNLNDGSGPHNTTRNKWSYDPSTLSIKSNINSAVYSGFISDQKLNNWYLKMRATGDDQDNDLFSILLGFMTDSKGREHTISAVRTLCVEDHTKYLWSIVYDYMQDIEFELVSNKCSQIESLPGGWQNHYAIIEAKRTGTDLKCWTSLISTSKDVESLQDSLLEYALPLTKPSNYSEEMYNNIKAMLLNPSRIGVGCHSQQGNFTILEQKYVFEDSDLYDLVNDVIWKYNESTQTWVDSGKASESLEDGRLYFNTHSKVLFYMDKGIAIPLTQGF